MRLTTRNADHREFAVRGGTVRLDPPGVRTVPLPADRHVLDVCLGGAMSEARVDGVAPGGRPCPPNSWRLLAAGAARTLDVDRSGRTLRIGFDPEALDGDAAREAVARAGPEHRFDDALLGIALTLVEHAIRHDIGRHLPASESAMRLADDAVRLILGRTVQCLEIRDDANGADGAYGSDGASPVARALRFVAEHLDEELTLARVAAHVGLSQYHFARTFRRDTGTSLRRHVIAQRIDRARTLLLRTDEGLADIAYRVGFGSQSHMTTLFGKHLGRTPAQLRRGRVVLSETPEPGPEKRPG